MSILSYFEELICRRSKTPWARFTTAGVVDGLVRYDMSWNPAFLDNLKKAGFTGHNEQEIVENFFLGSMIIPKEDGLNAVDVGEDSLQPAMTSDKNRLRR